MGRPASGPDSSEPFLTELARVGSRPVPEPTKDASPADGVPRARRAPASPLAPLVRDRGATQTPLGPMRTIRVCHVITQPDIGGAQENTILSCALVDRSKFSSTVLVGPRTGSEGGLFDLAEEHGVQVEVVKSLFREVSLRNDLRALRELRSYFARDKPDIVHTHSSKAGQLGRLAARLEGVPGIVHTVHGWSFHPDMSPLRRQAFTAAERLAARWSDAIVVVTGEDRVKGLASGIGRPGQYQLVRSGFDVAAYRDAGPSRRPMRRELGVSEDSKLVMTVGRLSPQKDPSTFVLAAREIVELVPRCQFAIVGDGPLRQQTGEHIRALGLEDRIRLTGTRRDVPALLAAADVFLLTSRWEGLPRVVVQALAVGLPVVASNVDGVKEVVDHSSIGSLVDPGDVEGFAREVARCLARSDVDEGDRAVRQRRAEEFDVSLMIEGLEEVYADVVSRAERTRHRRRRWSHSPGLRREAPCGHPNAARTWPSL
jgi:glycosyltransferase involved in cell wall biosynthesis